MWNYWVKIPFVELKGLEIMNKELLNRKEILSKRLKELLAEKGWNNKQFCLEFNGDKSDDVTLSESKLSDILRCNRETSYLVVAKMSHVLGVSCDYLLGITNTRTINPQIKYISDLLGIPSESLERYATMLKEQPATKEIGKCIGFLFEDLYARNKEAIATYDDKDAQHTHLIDFTICGTILSLLNMSDHNYYAVESGNYLCKDGISNPNRLFLPSFEMAKLLGSKLGDSLWGRRSEYARYIEGKLSPDDLYNEYTDYPFK